MARRTVDPSHRGFARAMRKTMTGPEFRLWSVLRGGRLEGLRFRRQTPIGPFIVDFFCPEIGLIVELDGDQHFHDAGEESDRRRDRWLAEAGYRVLRFANVDVTGNMDGVCWAILAAAEDYRRTIAHPERP